VGSRSGGSAPAGPSPESCLGPVGGTKRFRRAHTDANQREIERQTAVTRGITICLGLVLLAIAGLQAICIDAGSSFTLFDAFLFTTNWTVITGIAVLGTMLMFVSRR
jgi:hypothetical protein